MYNFYFIPSFLDPLAEQGGHRAVLPKSYIIEPLSPEGFKRKTQIFFVKSRGGNTLYNSLTSESLSERCIHGKRSEKTNTKQSLLNFV